MQQLLLSDPTVDERAELGERGEALAAQYLAGLGYRLVASNFRVPVGRNAKGVQVTGEIDLIALDGATLCFVEVKTRRSSELFDPLASVNIRKQRQITRTAKVYRRIFRVRDVPFRYDVITIVRDGAAEPRIEHIRSFWTDVKFHKKRWNFDRFDEFS